LEEIRKFEGALNLLVKPAGGVSIPELINAGKGSARGSGRHPVGFNSGVHQF
jgi:hypothetical protein